MTIHCFLFSFNPSYISLDRFFATVQDAGFINNQSSTIEKTWLSGELQIYMGMAFTDRV